MAMTLGGRSYQLSEAEGREIFNKRAQEQMHLSGDEFLAKWRRGDYRQDDLVENDDLMSVAMLLPLVEDDIGLINERPESVRAKFREAFQLMFDKASDHLSRR